MMSKQFARNLKGNDRPRTSQRTSHQMRHLSHLIATPRAMALGRGRCLKQQLVKQAFCQEKVTFLMDANALESSGSRRGSRRCMIRPPRGGSRASRPAWWAAFRPSCNGPCREANDVFTCSQGLSCRVHRGSSGSSLEIFIKDPSPSFVVRNNVVLLPCYSVACMIQRLYVDTLDL